MVTKVISILFMSALFIGCIQYKIHMPTDSGYKDQLKLDGFYYTSINPKSDAVHIIFIYKNGMVVDLLTLESLNIEYLNMLIKNHYKNNHHVNKKLHWGLFELNENSVRLTSWYPSSGGPLPVFVKRGEVINDTTFVIKWYETTKGKKIKDLNDVYHFHKFSPKPDSTNSLIK